VRYSVSITLFPEAPIETREFATMQDAKTFAFHKRAALKSQFYTITICPESSPGVALEIMVGQIYRGIHEG
jgi:hypothetical protein